MTVPVHKNKYRIADHKKLFLLSILFFIFSGCKALVQKEAIQRPIQLDKTFILSQLAQRYEKIMPFRANGKCLWQGVDAQGKPIKENFPLRLWCQPPKRFCFHGDVFFDSKGIVAGLNEENFWLVARPKEIKGYFCGSRYLAGNCSVELAIPLDPVTLMDAFGIIEPTWLNDKQFWSFEAEEKKFIMTRQNQQGGPIRKVYLDSNTFLPERIEYFDNDENMIMVTILDDYSKIDNNFYVPEKIEITQRPGQADSDSITITLKNPKQYTFSEKNIRYLFSPPSMDKFEFLYQLNDDCSWTEVSIQE